MAECKMCGKCCKYIAVEIDKPTCKEDYNHILWFLLHERVIVYKQDSSWYVEFHTPCKMLGEDNRCTFYSKRPKICRDHSPRDCENNCREDFELEFRNADEFLKYLKKKKINYMFKNFKKD